MNGREFLDVANFLQQLDSEASLRCQVGRIYYAAYLEARAWCETHLDYQRMRLGREHVEVPALLAALDNEIADDLRFLRSYRNTADYELHVSKETILTTRGSALARASNVLARLDTLEPPSPEPESEPES